MPYFYLITTTLLSAATSVFGKLFHKRNEGGKDGSPLYTLALIISALLGWGVIYIFDFSFDVGVLAFSILFSLFYIMGTLGIIRALECGPAMLTSLFIGLSLLIPTVWGFFFWNSPVSIPVIIGLVLVALSIFLCIYTKEKKEKALSGKWFFFITLSVLGNAGCTIVQRHEQMYFEGKHGTMLMVFSMLFSALIYLFFYLKGDHSEDKQMLKRAWWAPVLAGGCNAVHNLLVILLATTALSASLIYPVIGVGGLAVVTVFSLFVFKEKMRWWQWAGVGVGAVAVALLSL